MFRMFVNHVQEQNQSLKHKQIASVLEIFIMKLRNISNKEIDIPTSLALKNWYLNKSQEEKFMIVDRFIREFYKDLY